MKRDKVFLAKNVTFCLKLTQFPAPPTLNVVKWVDKQLRRFEKIAKWWSTNFFFQIFSLSSNFPTTDHGFDYSSSKKIFIVSLKINPSVLYRSLFRFFFLWSPFVFVMPLNFALKKDYFFISNLFTFLYFPCDLNTVVIIILILKTFFQNWKFWWEFAYSIISIHTQDLH